MNFLKNLFKIPKNDLRSSFDKRELEKEFTDEEFEKKEIENDFNFWFFFFLIFFLK
jgi:hypothetical protein